MEKKRTASNIGSIRPENGQGGGAYTPPVGRKIKTKKKNLIGSSCEEDNAS